MQDETIIITHPNYVIRVHTADGKVIWKNVWIGPAPGDSLVAILSVTAPERAQDTVEMARIVFGADFMASAEIFEEGIDVLLKAWNSPGPWSHKGKYYDIPEMRITPSPVQKPLPAYVGSFSKPSIELAGRLNCGLIVAPFAAAMTFGGLKQVADLYHETCAKYGNKPGRLMCSYFTHFADTPAQQAEQRARQIRYYKECVIPALPGDPARAYAGRGATDAQVDEFLTLTDDPANRPIFIHCTAAIRVGAFWLIRRVVRDGYTWDAALAEADARHLHRLERCLQGQVRSLFAGRGNPAAADAGALEDPFIRGLDPRLEVLVGDDAFRQVGAATRDDRAADQQEVGDERRGPGVLAVVPHPVRGAQVGEGPLALPEPVDGLVDDEDVHDWADVATQSGVDRGQPVATQFPVQQG
mgnify:CR=1 FL=1